MSNYYMGQIMMTGFGFAPKFFAGCNGALVGITQNQALFSLLGTQFGGDGRSTFALPDLRSRVPAGAGSSADSGWNPPAYPIGTIAGVESVSLLEANIPAHSHLASMSSAAAASGAPQAGGTIGTPAVANKLYASAGSGTVPMAFEMIGPAGSSAPHSNLQPLQSINFNISTSGIFPSRG